MQARSADSAAFADYLTSCLQPLGQIEKLKLKVLAIDNEPAAATGEKPAWQLRLLLLARGRTEAGGVADLASEHLVRCRFAGDDDIIAGQIVENWRVASHRSRSAPAPMFHDATAQFGLDELGLRDNWRPRWDPVRTYSMQVAVDDFDRDGFLDIAISALDGHQLLLRNQEGKSFVDVTEHVGLPAERTENQWALATWFDYDNDGFPDLLLGDALYHNESGQKFVNETFGSGLQFHEEVMGCAVADYDLDGKLDLYVLNHRASMQTEQRIGYIDDSSTGAENRLWRNLGGGRFFDVTAAAGVGAGRRHSFAATWFDANDDLIPDLYVANDFGSNQLYINDGQKRFKNIADEVGVGDFATSMGVVSGDITGDGVPEIYVANMFSKMGRRIIQHVQESDYPDGIYAQIQGSCAGNRLYQRGTAGQPYEEISEQLGVNQVGWAYAPALIDFDADGWLDIYATAGFLSFDPHKPDG